MSKCVVSHFRIITWPQAPGGYKEGTGPEACSPFPEGAAPREGTRALGGGVPNERVLILVWPLLLACCVKLGHPSPALCLSFLNI